MSRNEERIKDEKVSRKTVVMAGSGDCEFLRRSFFDKGKFEPLADWLSLRPSIFSPSNYWRGKRLITAYESSAGPVSSYTTLTHLA